MNILAYLSARTASLRFLARWLGYALLACALLPSALAVLLIDHEPWVLQQPASAPHDLAAARSLLHHTASPPGQAKDKVRSISLSEEDLTAVANYALTRKHLPGYAEAKIDGQRLVVMASIKLPIHAEGGHYFNLKLIADDAEPVAFVKQVKLGFIALPKPLVRVLFWWLTHTTRLGRYLQMILPLVQQIRIGDGRLNVTLNWGREVMGKVQELVVELADKERVRVYQAKSAETLAHAQTRRFVSLASLMRPLFELAGQRSRTEQNVAVAENRAVILVLAAYANGKSLATAIGQGEGQAELPRREVLLNRRVDAAQHFTGSALLTIAGHRVFADMVGIAKEFNDAHGGSGFSFIDLAADRAGAMFGKLAVNSEESALWVQDIVSQSPDESAYMPTAEDLPENLTEEAFAAQYGDTDSPQFEQMKEQIEQRIAACRLYQLVPR